MQQRDWKLWIALGLGALVILWVASSLFSGPNFGAWGMMGPDTMGNWHAGRAGHGLGGHMGGGWGFGPFGLIFGLMGLMFRIGFLVLLVLGGFWLFNQLGGTQGLSSMVSTMSASAQAPATCAHCGQPVQRNWQHCPHCGQLLAQANDVGGGPGGTPPTETVHP